MGARRREVFSCFPAFPFLIGHLADFSNSGVPNQEKVPPREIESRGSGGAGNWQLAKQEGKSPPGRSHTIAIISTTTHALSRLYPTMSTLTSATSFVTGSRRVTSGARATTATRRGPVRVEAMGFGDRKKKVDESVGGAVGGAVLGGLLLGPFGAIIGGNVGASFGANKKAARMEDEALRKQGISKEMVAMVTEVAQSLANAEDALKTAKESLGFELEDTLSLEAEANELYNMATAAVQSGDDDTARKHLTERKRVQAKMEDAKRRAAEAKGRVARVEQSVESLASQAKKLESVLKENMASAAELNAREAAAKFQDAVTPSVEELELDDPLERKFRELEGR